MTVKIGDIDISRYILPPEITDVFRSQSVAQTLNGSLVVDRICGAYENARCGADTAYSPREVGGDKGGNQADFVCGER